MFQLKTTEFIVNILVEHFDYFLETEKIKKRECEDCIKNKFPLPPNPECKERVYKAELDFYMFYKSLQHLLELKKISKEIIQPFVEKYHRIKFDVKLLEDWYWDADELECTFLNNNFFNNIIVFEKEKTIGMKPIDTGHYEEDSFIISIDGYESFIEYEFILKNLKICQKR